MKHSWTRNASWDVNNKKWHKWFKYVSPFLFNNIYGLPELTMDTKCPNQVLYISLVDIVLKLRCKRDYFQITIFVNVCSTWSIVELETHLETWITRNDINGLSMFHLSYLITLMVYVCSQWTRNVQMKYCMFDWSIYRLFVLNRGWKRVRSK
jgi:hypothetical protein